MPEAQAVPVVVPTPPTPQEAETQAKAALLAAWAALGAAKAELKSLEGAVERLGTLDADKALGRDINPKEFSELEQVQTRLPRARSKAAGLVDATIDLALRWREASMSALDAELERQRVESQRAESDIAAIRAEFDPKLAEAGSRYTATVGETDRLVTERQTFRSASPAWLIGRAAGVRLQEVQIDVNDPTTQV